MNSCGRFHWWHHLIYICVYGFITCGRKWTFLPISVIACLTHVTWYERFVILIGYQGLYYSIATWSCRKSSANGSAASKLRCHWLKGLQQRGFAVIPLGHQMQPFQHDGSLWPDAYLVSGHFQPSYRGWSFLGSFHIKVSVIMAAFLQPAVHHSGQLTKK